MFSGGRGVCAARSTKVCQRGRGARACLGVAEDPGDVRDIDATTGKLFDRLEDVRRDTCAVFDKGGWPVRGIRNR